MERDAPTCPHCGTPMRLTRELPESGEFAELRVYECANCLHLQTDGGVLPRPEDPAASAIS